MAEVENQVRFRDFNEWVHSWTRAMEHRDAFTAAFAIANGQQPPAE